ncbi:Enoyl-CoA hydratase/carnithine racemase [Saccharopolyspora kobensis]|uniref:Enoyl-CoA hydratase/carnithine racemase n=1 Tax=Saccharopolyspora kobensis TaxID=146035 RepID=A0A1H5TRQ8_9PSEU|nr:enoyl-CoA hydratase/isomerase family protein [Saccharopolyspora kobensis]SEF64697.1 Enoyl-CoA hydratase/carnithine racemase [Saccharopolyspora kobensis]SFC43921.1 Enoyl-CoA hydratase/carnithine racemase [Saccharopolyspora kobensis]
MAESMVDAGLLDRGGVGLTIRGRRATITLNRPDKLNAQTPHTWQALREIGRCLGAEVRVVVLRGAGRAFSAGLDRRLFTAAEVDGAPGLAGLARRPTEQADAEIAGYQQGFSWLREPDRVTIAAVRGHAIGAGFQLALACDLRVVAADASFRMAETGLGLVPDLGGTLPLVRTVGYARAVEICLTGREILAVEALRLGLVNAVVEPERLDVAVDELAEAVARPPLGAVRETLALLAQADEAVDPEQQLAAERAAQLRRIAELAAQLESE